MRWNWTAHLFIGGARPVQPGSAISGRSPQSIVTTKGMRTDGPHPNAAYLPRQKLVLIQRFACTSSITLPMASQ